MATSLLDQILAKAQETNVNSAAATANAQENFRQGERFTQQITDLLTQKGQYDATVIAAKQAADLKAQKDNASVAVAAGIDQSAGVDKLVELATKQKTANSEAEVALHNLRAAKEIDPFSDPIRFVKSYILDVPVAKTKFEGAVTEAQFYDSRISSVNKTLQESFQTNNARKEAVTAASADAAARSAAVESAIAAKRAQLEGLTYNSAGLNVVANASKEQLAVIHTAQNAVQAEQRLKIEQDNSIRDASRFSWQQEEAALRKEQINTNRSVDQSIGDAIRASIVSSGGLPPDDVEIKAAIDLFKRGASEEYARHYQLGRKILTDQVPRVGVTPADSAIHLDPSIATNLSEMRRKTAELVLAYKQEVDNNRNIDKKDKVVYSDAINKLVNEKVASDFISITPNTKNMFDVGDISQYFGMRAVASLPVVTKILAPLAQQKVSLEDPTVVLKAGAKGVLEKTITSTEFLELATVFQTANQINQRARGLVGFGIIPPKAGLEYNAKLTSRTFFNSPVDLTKSAALGRWLANELSDLTAEKPFTETQSTQNILDVLNKLSGK